MQVLKTKFGDIVLCDMPMSNEEMDKMEKKYPDAADILFKNENGEYVSADESEDADEEPKGSMDEGDSYGSSSMEDMGEEEKPMKDEKKKPTIKIMIRKG